MPGPRNVAPEVRARATLEFLELAVRDQLPDDEDPTSDYEFMSGCLGMLQSDLRVLKQQASAAWTRDFGRMLDRAEAMRLVPIALDSKDPRRQKPQRCDACGRYEKWCGTAFDLAGGEHAPEIWWGGNVGFAQKWTGWIEGYDYRSEVCPPCHENEGVDRDLAAHDMGRFFVGNTCLRKAKLHFIVSTLVPRPDAQRVVQRERSRRGGEGRRRAAVGHGGGGRGAA